MKQWRHPQVSTQAELSPYLSADSLSLAQRLKQLPAVSKDTNFIAAIEESNALPIPNDLAISIHVPDELETGVSYQKWALPMIDQLKGLSTYFDKDRQIQELQVQIKTSQPVQTLVRHLVNRIDAHFKIASDAKLTISVPIGIEQFEVIDSHHPFSHLHIDYVISVDDIKHIEAAWIERQRIANCSIGLALDLSATAQHDFKHSSAPLREMIWLGGDRITFESLTTRTPCYKNALSSIPDLNELLEELEQNQYHPIGSGIFAKTSCPLAQAYLADELGLGINGFLVQSKLDQIGIGLGAASLISDYVALNHANVAEYFQDISQRKFPIGHGMTLSKDDVIRQVVISELLCHYSLPIDKIQRRFGICFKQHFHNQHEQLKQMQFNGLLTKHRDTLEVTDQGLSQVSQIAALFSSPIRSQQPHRIV